MRLDDLLREWARNMDARARQTPLPSGAGTCASFFLRANGAANTPTDVLCTCTSSRRTNSRPIKVADSDDWSPNLGPPNKGI